MPDIQDSILDTTKRQLGLDLEDDSYDVELVMHINSIFFIFNQVGLGPKNGFSILDKDAVWSEFIGEDQIHAVRTLMGLRVKLIFDPPDTGPMIAAIERVAEQMEWRLNIHMEGVRWDEALKASLPSME